MLKKWKRNLTLLGILTLPISLAISCGTNGDNILEPKQFIYNNLTFNSKNELLSYLKTNDIRTDYLLENNDYSSLHWKIKGSDQVFLTLKDLDQYVEKNYVEKVTANIYLDKPLANDEFENFFASIPLNSVRPLQYDAENNVQGLAYVYKGLDGNIYFTTNKDEIKDTEKVAKKSWIKIHSAYLFNGIYFANIEDLKYYLTIKYQGEAQAAQENGELASLKNYQVVIDSKTGKTAYTIATNASPDLLANPNPIISNEDDLFNIIKTSIANSSSNSFKIGKEAPNYVSFDNILANNINIAPLKANLNYWNVGADNGESFYIVDNDKSSRGELFGNYFQKSPEDLGGESKDQKYAEGIMYQKNWNPKSEIENSDLKNGFDPNGQMIGSLISMALANFSTHVGNYDENSELNQAIESEISLSEILIRANEQKYFKNYNIDLKGQSFFVYLNNISGNNIYTQSLGTDLEAMSKDLIRGKRYNPFYLLPISRDYVISRLIANQVKQVELENVNNVFIALADMLSAEVNKLLSPFFLPDSLIASPDVINLNLHNGLDLNTIYGFKNHSNSIYNDPRTDLDEAFAIDGPAQNLINSVQSNLTNMMIANANDLLLDITENMTNNESKNFNLALLKPFNLTKEHLQEMTNFTNYTLAKLPFLINPLITKAHDNINLINNQYQFLNQKVTFYNGKIQAYNKRFNNYSYNQSLESEMQKAKAKLRELENEIMTIIFQTPIYQESESLKTRSNVLNSVNNIVINNIFFITSKEIGVTKNLSQMQKKMMLIAKNTKKLLRAVKWVSIGVSVVSSIINVLTKQYNTVFYETILPNDNKIIWNGGEQVTKWWKTTNTYDLNDLELINPIRITISHHSSDGITSGDASQFYFNGKFYNDPSDAYFDGVNNLISIKDSKQLIIAMQSLFNDVELVKEYAFSIPGKAGPSYWQNETDLINLCKQIIYGLDQYNDLVPVFGDNKPILVQNQNFWHLNLDSKYLKTIWKTSGGYTDNQFQAINDYIRDILAEIKPIYIFQIPETLANGDLKKEIFELPYPYFSMASGQIEKLGKINPKAHLQKIYDPNIKEDIGEEILTDNEIIEKIMNNWAFNQINVPSKVVSLDTVLANTSFDDIQEIMVTKEIYKATNPFGQIKYYWTLSAALGWLKTPDLLGAHILDNANTIKIYYFTGLEQEGEKQQFRTIEELFTWLMNNNVIKEVNNG